MTEKAELEKQLVTINFLRTWLVAEIFSETILDVPGRVFGDEIYI